MNVRGKAAYHVTQWTGVDVGVMNAAVLSVGVLPVVRTFVMFTKPPGGFRGHD